MDTLTMPAPLSGWPSGVTDPLCPQDHPIADSTDRRLLWHIENQLVVLAPLGSQLDHLGRELRMYLNATCEHHWHEHPGEGYIDAHRQCLWCHEVDWRMPGSAAA